MQVACIRRLHCARREKKPRAGEPGPATSPLCNSRDNSSCSRLPIYIPGLVRLDGGGILDLNIPIRRTGLTGSISLKLSLQPPCRHGSRDLAQHHREHDQTISRHPPPQPVGQSWTSGYPAIPARVPITRNPNSVHSQTGSSDKHPPRQANLAIDRSGPFAILSFLLLPLLKRCCYFLFLNQVPGDQAGPFAKR